MVVTNALRDTTSTTTKKMMTNDHKSIFTVFETCDGSIHTVAAVISWKDSLLKRRQLANFRRSFIIFVACAYSKKKMILIWNIMIQQCNYNIYEHSHSHSITIKQSL